VLPLQLGEPRHIRVGRVGELGVEGEATDVALRLGDAHRIIVENLIIVVVQELVPLVVDQIVALVQ